MGHLIAYEQQNTPQTSLPLSHMIPISHTKCQLFGQLHGNQSMKEYISWPATLSMISFCRVTRGDLFA